MARKRHDDGPEAEPEPTASGPPGATGDRLVNPAPSASEQDEDAALRPKTFADFIGQRKVAENLAVYVTAAKRRAGTLDHVLLSGPPGLGKTTLAHVIAHELGTEARVTSRPGAGAQGRPGRHPDLAGPRRRAVHRRDPPPVAGDRGEPVPGDGGLPHRDRDRHGRGRHRHHRPDRALHPGGRHHPHRAADLAAAVPLRHRRALRLLRRRGADGDREAVGAPAGHRRRRGRGARSSAGAPAAPRASPTACCTGCATSPRCAATAASPSAAADYALRRLEIDELGLDAGDRRLLQTIIQRYDGGPVGIEALAASLAEDRDTLEYVYEPYLIQEGFLIRTPRGRQASRQAYEHLKLPPPPGRRARAGRATCSSARSRSAADAQCPVATRTKFSRHFFSASLSGVLLHHGVCMAAGGGMMVCRRRRCRSCTWAWRPGSSPAACSSASRGVEHLVLGLPMQAPLVAVFSNRLNTLAIFRSAPGDGAGHRVAGRFRARSACRRSRPSCRACCTRRQSATGGVGVDGAAVSIPPPSRLPPAAAAAACHRRRSPPPVPPVGISHAPCTRPCRRASRAGSPGRPRPRPHNQQRRPTPGAICWKRRMRLPAGQPLSFHLACGERKMPPTAGWPFGGIRGRSGGSDDYFGRATPKLCRPTTRCSPSRRRSAGASRTAFAPPFRPPEGHVAIVPFTAPWTR